MHATWALQRELSVGTNVINRVDIKTQYVHRYRGRSENSTESGYSGQSENHSIQKPLQGSAFAQISFKGFNFSGGQNPLKPLIKSVPKRLTNKVFASIKKVSEEQYSYYSKIRDEYVNLVKNSNEFRARFGFGDDAAKEISTENLFYRPNKKILSRFADNLIAPFKLIGKGIKRLFTSKDSAKNTQQKYHEKVMSEFSSLEGLINSHEIWENGYRKMSGHSKWSPSAEFLIPDDVLISKIKRRRNKVVDPNKGKYSTTSLMLGNRLISGSVYAYFLGNDAYNTTMRYSNDKTEAQGQRKSRVAQEFSRIGLNMYIQNLLFGTFETAVNKSLPTALFVSGSTVAFSEILGRKLVGKPIMPSNKETLDRLEKEMDEKKGFLPALGRLLTRAKKPANKEPQKEVQVSAPKNIPFSKFGQKPKSAEPAVLSFKGYYSVAKTFEKKRLADILSMIKISDFKEYENMKESIVKSVRKSKLIKDSAFDSLGDINKAFEYIMQSESLKEIPLGTQNTFWGQLTKSILVPFRFVRDTGVSVKNSAVKFFKRVMGEKGSASTVDVDKILNSPSFKYKNGFNAFLEKRLELPAWTKSGLSAGEKKNRIFAEYVEVMSKESEEIEGLKNILIWLDKQIVKAGVKVKEDGTLSPEDVKKIQDLMKESVLKADGAKHVEYDGNKLSQTNINLARAITTIFLVTDAYNLTMQYSNDNKKDSNKSAKNRAAQEVSRIGFSAYILAFVHNLLSKMCNSSLAGAFGLTAMTSVINDSISRKIVGVPLRAKSQEELSEIDEKNSKSKNPVKKALAYSMGKKSPSIHKIKTSAMQDADFDDVFITPSIA